MSSPSNLPTSLPLRVLITGAANGLGRATALVFARNGWQVIATDNDTDALTSLSGQEGIITRVMDVTSDASVSELFRELAAGDRSLDLIVNNAGVDRYFPLSEASVKLFMEIFEINLFGAYRVNQVFLPLLKSPGGRIILIGSESYHLTLPFMPYPLTKRALESYAKALRQELRFKGIDVVIVRPGAIRTGFIDNLSGIRPRCLGISAALRYPVSDPALNKAFIKFTESVPGEVGKVIPPEKVAALIYRVSGIRPRSLGIFAALRHPASVYRINNSCRLRLTALLPFRLLEKAVHSRLR